MDENRLTQSRIEKHLRTAPAQRLEIPDGGGLFLVVQPSGKVSWAYRYRAGTKTRKLTIGNYPKLSLKEARGARNDARQKLELGLDPAREALALKRDEAIRFGNAARRYVREFHIARRGNRYWAEVARQLGLSRELTTLKGGLVDRFETMAVDAIPASEIYAFIREQSGVQSNRVLANLKVFYKWACDPAVALATRNPVADFGKPAEETIRTRVLTDEELRAVWRGAAKLGPIWCACVRMLLLTGQRRDEVARLPWGEIRGDTWLIPDERAKNGREHEVHLVPAVRALLEALPRTGPYVFSNDGRAPVGDFTKQKAKLDSASGVRDWWFHDLRRTMATRLGGLGVPMETVEAMLNHRSGSRGGIRAVYQQQSYRAQAYRAWQAWSRYVEFILDDDLFARLDRRLQVAEDKYDRELERSDALLRGGDTWRAFVDQLREDAP